MTSPTWFSRSFKGSCYGKRFLAPICENCTTHLHSVSWHSTTDGRIATWNMDARITNTADAPSTSDRNWVRVLHAGLCHAFLVFVFVICTATFWPSLKIILPIFSLMQRHMDRHRWHVGPSSRLPAKTTANMTARHDSFVWVGLMEIRQTWPFGLETWETFVYHIWPYFPFLSYKLAVS